LNDFADLRRRNCAGKMQDVSRRKTRFPPRTAAAENFRAAKRRRKNAETKRRRRKTAADSRPEKTRRKPFHAAALYFSTGFPQTRPPRFRDFFCIFTEEIYKSRNYLTGEEKGKKKRPAYLQ